MAEDNLFNILEHRGKRGFFPLNENHWSNVLAWLLEPKHENNLLGRSLLELISPGWNRDTWKVEREIEYFVESRRRRIDIQITSDQGLRLFVEVKIDPTYQDRDQIMDQFSILSANERLVIISPLDLSLLLADATTASGCSPKTFAVTWRSISKWCAERRTTSKNLEPLTAVILDGIERYWSSIVTTPFEQMVQTILQEQRWTTFFPDEFKEVFLKRFPEVWAAWVAEKPESGNGNPHQYLMTSLSMLANRKNGFRLFRTGNSRRPKKPDWGYPTIYEMSVMASDKQPEE